VQELKGRLDAARVIILPRRKFAFSSSKVSRVKASAATGVNDAAQRPADAAMPSKGKVNGQLESHAASKIVVDQQHDATMPVRRVPLTIH
jgi:hypothetical protein